MAIGAIMTITVVGIGGILAAEAMNKGYFNISLKSGESSFIANKNSEKSIDSSKKENQ